MFDTKIAIVLADDLAPWQSLNVTAFLTGGIVAQSPEVIGEAYRDRAGTVYNPLIGQPIIVLSAGRDRLATIQARARDRGITTSAYVADMFETGHDAANRAAFARTAPEDGCLVGLALRGEASNPG